MDLVDIPADMLEMAQKNTTQKMVEAAAETDDELMEKYLDGEELTERRDSCRPAQGARSPASIDARSVRHVLPQQGRSAAAGRDRRFPALARWTFRRSRAPSMDTDEEIERKASDDEPFCALAFKIMADPFVGKLAFFRVYSGKLASPAAMYTTPPRASASALAAFCRMHANHREEIDEIRARRHRRCRRLEGDHHRRYPLRREPPDRSGVDGVPGAGYPRSHRAEDQGRSGQDEPCADAVWPRKIRPSRPTPTSTTGQTIIAGMGELHLEIIVDRLLREFKRRGHCRQTAGCLQGVPSANAPRPKARYVRQTGGHGQFGHCVIEIYPARAGHRL